MIEEFKDSFIPKPYTRPNYKVVDEVSNEQKEANQLISFLDRRATRTEIIQHFNKLTIHDVVENEEYKSLRALARLYGNEKVKNGIAILLKDTSKAYDKVWSAAKAKETATEIFHSEYSYITLEDVFVLLKRIKENDFSYTPASVMKQLKKYADERFEVAKEKSKIGELTYINSKLATILLQLKEDTDDRSI